MIKKINFTKIFLDAISDCPEYFEALKIVKENSSGKIWLIGGFVFRTLASQLYDLPNPECDLDFIVEKVSSDFVLPAGWKIKSSRFGNPKFAKNNKEIDLVPIEEVYSISKRKFKPTIENYLTGTPLNIQSIAFDVIKHKIIGDVGIKSLIDREIRIYNLDLARFAAEKKNINLKKMILDKANDLKFKPILP
ncbi:MAG: hypothetical protein NTW79_04080 [Candidatus Berkelbacteria bacterium]|nr:hypothetical protein [Candidatus Berkelbacteria bacterium]